jgi:hypothetical protein
MIYNKVIGQFLISEPWICDLIHARALKETNNGGGKTEVLFRLSCSWIAQSDQVSFTLYILLFLPLDWRNLSYFWIFILAPLLSIQ